MNVRSVNTLFIAGLLAVSSCAETRPDDATAEQELEAAAVDNSLAADQAEANEYERRMKRASANDAPVGPVAQKVDWDEARGFKQLNAALLPAEQQRKLDAVRLPVLAFDDPELLGGALLTHHENWYVVAVQSDDGLNMNIRGTRNAWSAPNMEIPKAAREAADNYTLTRTHGIVTVSWRAFDASYSVDIECAKPLEDGRCTEDEFALDVVEQLGVIGGVP